MSMCMCVCLCVFSKFNVSVSTGDTQGIRKSKTRSRESNVLLTENK